MTVLAKIAAIPSTAPVREAVLATARAYADHRWRATAANAFHGVDDRGVRVDTPDASITELGWRVGANVGVPYMWGGSSTLAAFDEALSAGGWAGNILVHGRTGDLRASRTPAGVDCSGLVSRCWELGAHLSTRDLPRISVELPGYDALEPGDVVNAAGDHVLIFERFVDGRAAVYEAGAWKVKRTLWTVGELAARRMVPLRDRRR